MVLMYSGVLCRSITSLIVLWFLSIFDHFQNYLIIIVWLTDRRVQLRGGRRDDPEGGVQRDEHRRRGRHQDQEKEQEQQQEQER